MNSTTAINHEWDGPYTAWGVDSDECDCEECRCGSRLCPECTVSWESVKREVGLTYQFWYAFYKIKRWLAERLPGSGR